MPRPFDPPSQPRRSVSSLQRAAQLAFTAAVTVALVGCGGASRPTVVSAEHVTVWDGQTRVGAEVRLIFDQVLPERFAANEALRVVVDPPLDKWAYEVVSQAGRELLLSLPTTAPDLSVEGVHGKDPGASGLGVQRAVEDVSWVDIRHGRSHPILVRTIWEDSSPRSGNLIVDQGDRLRLVFDRPVRLVDDRAILRPRDLILSKRGDRLDDGRRRSRLLSGKSSNEISVLLGSQPAFRVAGRPNSAASEDEDAPSTLALNGTQIFPLRSISDTSGRWGAVSTHEVDIEFTEDFPQPFALSAARFPQGRQRTSHSVTPIARNRALIVGGQTVDDGESTGEILLFDPLQPELLESPSSIVARPLPTPVIEHSATLLAGPDGLPDTSDDLVVVVGGRPSRRKDSLGTITVIRPNSEQVKMTADALATNLRVPRHGHSAVAVGPLQLLVDGGKTQTTRQSGFVGCAELIEFSIDDDQSVSVSAHTVFRTRPRREHSLTVLPPTADENSEYVLAYGGYGLYEGQRVGPGSREGQLGELIAGEPDDDVFFTGDERATVLVSPELYNLGNLTASIDLKYRSRGNQGLLEIRDRKLLPLLRWGHAAVLVETTRSSVQATVAIAGGKLVHPFNPAPGNLLDWEVTDLSAWDVTDLDEDYKVRVIPQGDEATNAIFFHFDRLDPHQSYLRIERDAQPGRNQPATLSEYPAVDVAGLGLLFLGGTEERRAISVFSTFKRSWSALAVSLTTTRVGHQAYVARPGGVPTLYVIGGRSVDAPGPGDELFAIEELRLR